MHNNIMAAGSKDRPPMLATGQYPQWRSRFLRYIDTRPNSDALRKCILNGPYIPTAVTVQAVAATDDFLAVPEHTTVETPMNISSENKAHFKSEKEAIHMILTGIEDEIYSTIDACQIAQEMWEAIERLQQARNANPLALVATAQANQDLYYQTSKSQKSYATSSKPSIPTRSHTITRYKGKKIAKPITPPSESAFEEDSDPEQAQRDKDIQKNSALIAKYFKRIYKPTNNNLRTSLNLRNKNVDMTPQHKNDNQSGQNLVILLRNAESQKGLKTSQTDKEIDEHELEAHYSYTVKIQEVYTADSGTDSEPLEHVQNDTGYNVFANDLKHSEQSESISNTCIVETNYSNVIPDSPDMCEDDIQNDQNDVESDDERVTLANLIANLKLKEEHDIDKMLSLEKQLKFLNEIIYKRNQSIQTIHMMARKVPTYNGRPTFADLSYLKHAQSEIPCLYAFPYDQSTYANRLIPDGS
nr:hypothetical protein [Tanacetum cinerariifolium]